MTVANVVTSAARVVLRSGLFAPAGPLTMVRIAREALRGGANPATVMAIAAVRWPDRTAVIDDDGALSYGQLQSRTESLAAALVYRYRVGPGVSVGILCRNGRVFIRGLFAAASVGADVVLLNTDFRTDALAAALGAHRIQTVICDDEFADRVRAADEGIAVVDFAALEIDQSEPRPKAGPPGRIVLLTSGTTGRPKGVPRTPSITAVLGVGVVFLDRIGLRAGSRIVRFGAHVSRVRVRDGVAHGDARRHAADETPVRRRNNARADVVASRARARCGPGHARPNS